MTSPPPADGLIALDPRRRSDQLRLSPVADRLHAVPERAGLLRYDAGDYDFPRIVSQLLDVSDLARLPPAQCHPQTHVGYDQDTELHRRFYARAEPFLAIYRRFLATVIAPLLDEPFCYQRIPTLRIHRPNGIAVSEFHVDSDYNHDPVEINFWVPLTKCWDSNSIWVESVPGKSDYRPVSLRPGELLVFDANRLHHGNLTNSTKDSRVSFDFRCIHLSRYKHNAGRSVAHGVELTIGNYFEIFRGSDPVESGACE